LRIAYIMRGISGSGKSTIARAIAKEERGQICSTDQYFLIDDKYCFDPTQLRNNHEANYQDFKYFAACEVPALICDNTNCQLWQFARYIAIAKKAGYVVRVVEVRHPPLAIAAERNTHQVPLNAILNMRKSWQQYPTQTRRRRQHAALGQRLQEVRRAPVRKPPARFDYQKLRVGGKRLWVNNSFCFDAKVMWSVDRGVPYFWIAYQAQEWYEPHYGGNIGLADTRVIWGQDRGTPYARITCVVPESDQPLYIAGNDNGEQLVIYGTTEGQPYEGIMSIPKIRDARPLYVAYRQGELERVVWGNVEGRHYQLIANDHRPEIYEGKPLYVAVDGSYKQFVVWGEMEAERFDHIPLPPQVVDGKLLYVGAGSKPRNSICTRTYTKVTYYSPQRIVWGPRQGREYDRITALRHAGQTLYYVAWKNRRACLVTDEQEGAWYRAIHGNIAFADTVPAYIAASDDGEMIVFGCREGRRYDWINHLTIAAGQPLAVAQSGVDRFVLWGKYEGPAHDWITSPPQLHHGQIHYRALEAGIEYRIWCELR